MKYLSVCSGIEAATVAWHGLGWEPVAFSEIEPFPSAVLAHHYPNTPNWGDMTKFQEWPDANVDVFVGGTPCQSFSVAGLRKGLADPRGNLMLTYLAIADRYRPKWVVWENVPGVLSSNGGQDFGTFLGGLGELGYGFAYRVLDAQYFGVAQRRRRVFVVGCLGDWRSAAAVLFERHSLQGHPAPSREKGQGVAGTIAARFGISRNNHEELAWDENVSKCLTAGVGKRYDFETETFPVTYALPIPNHEECVMQPIPIHDQATRHAGKRGEHSDGKGNGLGVGQPGDPAPTLTKGDKHAVAQPVAIGLDEEQNARIDGFGTLKARMEGGGFEGAVMTPAMQVRRLTPVECERLQGFPDDYTNIPWRKKDEAPDGPRYKALGNSMAVPCMRWIGERIQMVEEIAHERT